MSEEKKAPPLTSDQPLKSDYPAGLSAPPAYGTSVGHGYQPQPAVMGQGFADQSPPPDYLVLSIITILCCFWPLGLVGLIKSVEARTNYQNGQYAQAHAAARDAKRYNTYGIIIGAIALVIGLGIAFISIIASVIVVAVTVSNAPTPPT